MKAADIRVGLPVNIAAVVTGVLYVKNEDNGELQVRVVAASGKQAAADSPLIRLLPEWLEPREAPAEREKLQPDEFEPIVKAGDTFSLHGVIDEVEEIARVVRASITIGGAPALKVAFPLDEMIKIKLDEEDAQ